MTPEYASEHDAALAREHLAHTTIRRDDAGNIVCFENRNAEGVVCSETVVLHVVDDPESWGTKEQLP